jgi:hypothetical protein
MDPEECRLCAHERSAVILVQYAREAALGVKAFDH